MSTVVMHTVVSVDGFIAEDHDGTSDDSAELAVQALAHAEADVVPQCGHLPICYDSDVTGAAIASFLGCIQG
ncbi:MAG TPA: hypothetical protein VME70_00190 [Mycobacteriales bacterium]|nr:hypothetical protein [Mycobacteriales bacterium]